MRPHRAVLPVFLALLFLTSSAFADRLQCIGRCHDRAHACLRGCHSGECRGRCHDQLRACVAACPGGIAGAAFDIRTFFVTAAE